MNNRFTKALSRLVSRDSGTDTKAAAIKQMQFLQKVTIAFLEAERDRLINEIDLAGKASA